MRNRRIELIVGGILCRLRDFEEAEAGAGAIDCIDIRVVHPYSVNHEPVVMRADDDRIGGDFPEAFGVLCHRIDDSADIGRHLFGIWSHEGESSAAFAVDAWIDCARDIVFRAYALRRVDAGELCKTDPVDVESASDELEAEIPYAGEISRNRGLDLAPCGAGGNFNLGDSLAVDNDAESAALPGTGSDEGFCRCIETGIDIVEGGP